ncbi:MAG: hypothetical protein JW909_08310 [Planctomycetes bacterium]|nr:hypothetical protein [Planctomycetota bacterium]
MTAEAQKPPTKTKRQAVKRYIRVNRTEDAGVHVMRFVWPVVGLITFSILVYGLARGFLHHSIPLEPDYSELFLGDVQVLPDGRVCVKYDFSPRPDGFVDYPQLQDWDYKKGVFEGWLLGQASLRAALTREVTFEFDFKLARGNNIMPAVGVRDRGTTRLAVLVEREGKASVWKFLKGKPYRLRENRTPYTFIAGEQHHLTIKAVTVYPDKDVDPEPLGPPPVPISDLEPDVANHPPLPPEELPQDTGPAPYTDVVVYLDDKEIIKDRVERYVLDGWVMLDAWNATALTNNVTITGRLWPGWVFNEIRIRNAIREKPPKRN